MLTIPLPFLISGLPDHVHPSPGYNQPDQLFLRQQHGASWEPRHVCPRFLRLPARGQLDTAVTVITHCYFELKFPSRTF